MKYYHMIRSAIEVEDLTWLTELIVGILPWVQ